MRCVWGYLRTPLRQDRVCRAKAISIFIDYVLALKVVPSLPIQSPAYAPRPAWHYLPNAHQSWASTGRTEHTIALARAHAEGLFASSSDTVSTQTGFEFVREKTGLSQPIVLGIFALLAVLIGRSCQDIKPPCLCGRAPGRARECPHPASSQSWPDTMCHLRVGRNGTPCAIFVCV
jgi:hypothetical protein